MGCRSNWVTLRSAVFFGASIHIFLGATNFCLFFWQLILYFRNFRRPEPVSLTWMSFFIYFLGATFLPLGCVIFRGIEKERLYLLRTPMWLFLLFKASELSLRVYQEVALFHPKRRMSPEDRIYQAIELGASSLYFLLLWCYIRRLQELEGSLDLYFKASEVDDLSIQRRRMKLLA